MYWSRVTPAWIPWSGGIVYRSFSSAWTVPPWFRSWRPSSQPSLYPQREATLGAPAESWKYRPYPGSGGGTNDPALAIDCPLRPHADSNSPAESKVTGSTLALLISDLAALVFSLWLIINYLPSRSSCQRAAKDLTVDCFHHARGLLDGEVCLHALSSSNTHFGRFIRVGQ